jgi:DNA mismatch repair protein MutS
MTLSNSTPMLRQYHELKRQHPGTLLFFRLGDFYELFFEDAITGSRELEITLTARHKERGDPIPMCGVPHHAASSHIARLVRKGYRVAICEQTEDPSKTKKLVRREVVRIVTPGTAIDPQLIEARECVYLAAVCGSGNSFAAAFLDLSTGEFRATESRGADSWPRILADLESYAPRELLFPASLAPLVKDAFSPTKHAVHTPSLTPLDDWLWHAERCAAALREQFGVRELTGYGLDGHNEAVRAAGVCLNYAREMQRATADHISDIQFFEAQDHLVLDSLTVRNLELTETQSSSTGASTRTGTVLGIIDATMTGMGARQLRAWLLRPSLHLPEIEARQQSVEALYGSQMKRDRLRASLKEVADLDRLIGRINMGQATARDLAALRRSLDQVPAIREALADLQTCSLLEVLYEASDDLPNVRELIARAINDEPPANLAEGGVVREGFNAELDELRSINRDAKQTIAQLESRERTRSGINTLRIRFNNVFGYYIEVSKAASSRVPADYERRQTLVNAERYTTPELKDWEQRVLGAEARIMELETSVFAEVRASIASETKRLQATARALAMLDCLASLAEVAHRRGYARPSVHEGDELKIVEGRHPVIEAISPEPFIPNDIHMNNSTDRLLIITGPNLGGKSTVLRQVALIQILAQIGSFVPASSATLPLVDRVWTRVGASDDLARGRSTFMVEMIETANILHNATTRSLVLLDEIGRGTATFDGLSIAWAVAEYLHDSALHAPKTLFATHYHELTELAERLPGAKNYQITVAERDGEVVFLHRLEKGSASKSYGIEVARLAGMPPGVLERARDVLQRLERYELDVFAEEDQEIESEAQPKEDWESWALVEQGLKSAAKRARARRISAQATLFDATNQSLLDELRGVDVENLSSDEARMMLLEMRKKLV